MLIIIWGRNSQSSFHAWKKYTAAGTRLHRHYYNASTLLVGGFFLHMRLLPGSTAAKVPLLDLLGTELDEKLDFFILVHLDDEAFFPEGLFDFIRHEINDFFHLCVLP
jgi:hypothetical protein